MPRRIDPKYIFGSAKAGFTQQVKAGMDRKPSKLPTSLEELNLLLKLDDDNATQKPDRDSDVKSGSDV